MYSADFKREVGGGFAVGFEYSGATGRDLGLGGANEGSSTSTRCPMQHWSLGAAALNENVPNPFFGLPAGQGFNVTSADDSRAVSCCVRSRSSATSSCCRPPRDEPVSRRRF